MKNKNLVVLLAEDDFDFSNWMTSILYQHGSMGAMFRILGGIGLLHTIREVCYKTQIILRSRQSHGYYNKLFYLLVASNCVNQSVDMGKLNCFKSQLTHKNIAFANLNST